MAEAMPRRKGEEMLASRVGWPSTSLREEGLQRGRPNINIPRLGRCLEGGKRKSEKESNRASPHKQPANTTWIGKAGPIKRKKGIQILVMKKNTFGFNFLSRKLSYRKIKKLFVVLYFVLGGGGNRTALHRGNEKEWSEDGKCIFGSAGMGKLYMQRKGNHEQRQSDTLEGSTGKKKEFVPSAQEAQGTESLKSTKLISES